MVWVASEVANVFLNPMECLPLIEESSIEISIFSHVLAGKESKDSDAVIEVDKYNVVTGLLNDFAAVIVAI